MDTEKKNVKNEEPEWLKRAAKTMLQGQKESSGDEDQDDVMNIIDKNEDDQL